MVLYSFSGVTFNFPKEVEKHLIMHFPEAKQALYARCIILVEGVKQSMAVLLALGKN